MIKIIDGNLFDSDAELICHQTNCMGKFNSGIAREVRERYSDVFVKYSDYCKHYSPQTILGTVQYIKINNDNRFIANMFGQLNYGYDGRCYTSLDALCSCLKNVANTARIKGYKVAMPFRIGCVRGGANWTEVYKMIEEIFVDVEVELWRLDKG